MEHPSNAELAMVASFEPASNVKSQRLRQSLKQNAEIVSMDVGRQTEVSDEHIPKADRPRVAALETDSNVKTARFSQRRKL
jgi:hypothetical protein